MTRKKKLLYISSVLPDTSCGAHLAIYRHFVLRNDFEISVCSYAAEYALTEEKFKINRIFRTRFYNTRFSRMLHNAEYLLNWFRLPHELLTYAKGFNPDAIITVPDNIHTGLAFQLSKKLRVPLICNFQDLFPLSRYIGDYMKPYAWMRKILLNRFFKAHRAADLVFYTSEGMQLFFGGHKNGHVLYPLGDFGRPSAEKHAPLISAKGNRVKIIYAGNCYGAYGRMLLQFAKLVKDSEEIDFRLFPVGKGWPDEDIEEMKGAGIYRNFLPFEELKKELNDCDAFLCVMSFEPEEAPFVKTSFTTKWLDYAPYGKPIFVWGPDYSSGYLFANKYNCGVVVSSPDAKALVSSIKSLTADEELWSKYSKNARSVSEKALNPLLIHSILVENIDKIAE